MKIIVFLCFQITTWTIECQYKILRDIGIVLNNWEEDYFHLINIVINSPEADSAMKRFIK